MEKELDIWIELAELNSRLAKLPKLQPFLLPDGGVLAELPAILAASAIDSGNVRPLAESGKAVPFEVPAGYFETLPATLMAPIDAAVQHPFSVPEGYDAQQLRHSVKSTEVPAKRSLPFRPMLRKAVPWLAAAAVMAGIWIGVRPGTKPVSPESQAAVALAALDKDSIGVYVELHAEDFDPENLEAALAFGSQRDLQDAVTELPESEILDYLNDVLPEAPSSEGS